MSHSPKERKAIQESELQSDVQFQYASFGSTSLDHWCQNPS